MRFYVCTLSLMICSALFAGSGEVYIAAAPLLAVELPEDIVAVAPDAKDDPGTPPRQQDLYIKAYLQGCVDTKFPKLHVTVLVRNGDVLVTNLPDDPGQARKVQHYVKKICVAKTTTAPDAIIAMNEQEQKAQEEIKKSTHSGTWFPQSTVLFPTMVANPRQICFSGGKVYNDRVWGKNNSLATFGDQFPVYRWSNVWRWKGDLQLELEAGVFAIFNHDTGQDTLANSDYYVGIPLSYAVDRWAFRGRIYHISSHLGDEFLLEHKKYLKDPKRRLNKSFEAVDFYTSYQLTNAIRLYGGVGTVVHSDSEMRMKPLYANYGFEVRVLRHNFKQLYGQPFLAVDIQNWQENNFEFSSTYALGYEWGKIYGIGRKVRLFFEYHDGFSPDGQFSRERTNWFAIRVSYGF